MAKDDQKPPEPDSSELVKFRRLAMKVLSVSKDEIYEIEPKPKRKTLKKTAKKSEIK